MRELNLIPYEMKEKNIKSQKNRKYASYGILVLCIVFIIAYFPLVYSNNLEKKATNIKIELDNKAYITENYNQVVASINGIKLPISLAEEVDNNKVFLSTTIDNLSKYVPKNINFTTFSYQEGGIYIDGESSSYNSCCEFIANLELSKEFSTAIISNINLEEETRIYSFTITIPQKGVANDEQTK
ncbi:MAG: PilN domain-containing protein [Clostridiaceae bacterium]